MKNFNVYFLLAILLFSCTTGDDNSDTETDIDPIIGLWKPLNVTIYYDNGEIQLEPMNECRLNSRVIFLASGIFEEKWFQLEDGVCTKTFDATEDPPDDNWFRNSNGKYTIIKRWKDNTDEIIIDEYYINVQFSNQENKMTMEIRSENQEESIIEYKTMEAERIN